MIPEINSEEQNHAPLEPAQSAGDRDPSSGRTADSAETEGACLGNTPLHTSHEANQYSEIIENSTTTLDWLETAGTVEWDIDKYQTLTEFKEKHTQAEHTKESVLIFLGGKTCLINPGGMGTGKQSRLTHRITWGSATLGIAFRNKASRQLSNFSLTVPGDTCVVFGYHAAREWAFKCLEELFGVITDEWIRRIDICCDLPGLDIQKEIIPAFKEDRYISSAKDETLHSNDKQANCISVGSRKRIRMIIYDKLKEHYNKPLDYQQALKQYRWKNEIPKAATRVEISFYRDWFAQYKENKTATILENPSVLLQKIFKSDKKSYFRFTKQKPDRKNNNQSRCETLEIWEKIINSMIADSNDCILELTRLERGSMSYIRAYGFVKGILCGVAAMMGIPITSLDDGKYVLELLHQSVDGKDQYWQECWEKKAAKSGTNDFSIQFP